LRYSIELFELIFFRNFSGNYFNNIPAVQPTFDQIIEIFGITSPGVYDNNSSVFLLRFPGLLFTFSIDFRVEPKITHGIQSLHFPAGRAPLVSKISIYKGDSPNTAMYKNKNKTFSKFYRITLTDLFIVLLKFR